MGARGDVTEGYVGEVRWVEDASLGDLAEFRSLKELRFVSEDAPIVVEGTETIRVLLSSNFVVEKLLLKPSLFPGFRESLEQRAERLREKHVPVYLAQAAVIESITGVPAKHASAALACARRRSPLASIDEALPRWRDDSAAVRALCLDGLDEEGVGALLRVAAAFGVDAVLLSPDCGDPFHRRAVRVSMGHVFRVPLLRGHLPSLLGELSDRGVYTIAAAPQDSAVCLDEVSALPSRWACAVGPDGPAAPATAAACSLQVAMRQALPSCPIGAGISAGVLLHGCRERESDQSQS